MLKRLELENGKIKIKDREYFLDKTVILKFGLYTLSIIFDKKRLILNKEDVETENLISSIYKYISSNFDDTKIIFPYKYKHYPILLNIIFFAFILISIFFYIKFSNNIWLILMACCFLVQLAFLFLYREIIVYENEITEKTILSIKTYQMKNIKFAEINILSTDRKPYIRIVFNNNKKLGISLNNKAKIYQIKMLFNLYNIIKSGHFA
jgi:hypothetical protein